MRRPTSVGSYSGQPRNERQLCEEGKFSSSFVKTHREAVKPPKTAGGHYVYFDEHVAAYREIYERNMQRAGRRAG
jgi:hypothetical protein